MNPTLEYVLFASPTVALNFNRVSKELEDQNLLFENRILNTTIIFKYPNFDVATEATGDSIPGLDSFLGAKSTKKPIRTAIFVPRDKGEMQLGGFGIFMDDENFGELSENYIGINADLEQANFDIKKLNILDVCPSFDPFLVKEAFNLYDVGIHEKYVEITETEAQEVRDLIQMRLKPIIARALNISNEGHLEKSTKQFLETIWDPRDQSGSNFMAAFGISSEETHKVFASWKGVAYFDNEFKRRQAASQTMLRWLKSEASTPTDYLKLTSHEKQQFDMFRKSVTQKILNVSNNISLILKQYDQAYQDFIDHSRPQSFQNFLKCANGYYWTLGGCNGVLAQALGTWKRYMTRAANGRLNYDTNERMLKVCDAILRAGVDDKQISL